MRKFIPITLGVLLSSLLLYFAFRNIDIKLLFETFAHIKIFHLLILFSLVCLEICIRGFKWKILLSDIVKTTTFQMSKFQAIGLALNNVLPLRLGEIARISIASHKLKVPFFTILSTVIVERTLDLITLLFLFLVFSKLNGVEWLEKYNTIVFVFFVLVLVLFIMFVFLGKIIEQSRLVVKILNRFPKIKLFLYRMSMGGVSLRNKKLILPAVISSLCLWLTDALIYWFSFMSLNIKPSVDFAKSIYLVCAGVVAGAIPAVPGYFGTFETALQQMLISWGVDKTQALGYAGYVHLVFYITMTSVGIIFLYHTGSSIGRIWRNFYKKR